MLWNPDIKKGTDRRILAEVKTGKPTTTEVRSFCHAMNEQNAIAGVFITFEPATKGMRQLAADMGTFEMKAFEGTENKQYPRLQFWQIDDTYFEDPDRVLRDIRLPREWIQPRKKSDRHFEEQQTLLLTEDEH